MKRFILLMIVSLPILLGVTLAQVPTDSGTLQDAAIVEFPDKTKLGGEVLFGKYYFEHDDSRMARGEACMYVFTCENGMPVKLVASFHCTPVERPKARDVIVTLTMSDSPSVFLLKEIQFKGSTKGHVVPGV